MGGMVRLALGEQALHGNFVSDDGLGFARGWGGRGAPWGGGKRRTREMGGGSRNPAGAGRAGATRQVSKLLIFGLKW